MSKKKEGPICKIEKLGIANTTLEWRIELRPDIFEVYEEKAKDKTMDVDDLLAEAVTKFFNRLSEETVEITVKVPKRFIQFLEDQRYFGQTREEWILNAVKSMISGYASNMSVNELRKLEKKYGDAANPEFYI